MPLAPRDQAGFKMMSGGGTVQQDQDRERQQRKGSQGREARPAPKESPEQEQRPDYTPQERTEEAQESGSGREMVRGKE